MDNEAIQAVGKCAQDVVTEVRNQFAERPGIMDGTQKPDYARCVAIVSSFPSMGGRRMLFCSTVCVRFPGLFFSTEGLYLFPSALKRRF